LTRGEIYRAKKAFGNTIPYGKIRVAHNSRLINYIGNSYIFNTIYLNKSTDSLSRSGVESYFHDMLIHCLTYAWQRENGIGVFKQILPTIKALFTKKSALDYGKYKGLELAYKEKKNFRDFNTEQQAHIMSKYYCFTFHKRQDGQDIHEHFARQAHFNQGYYFDIKMDTFAYVPYYMPRDSLYQK
jgi:predicted transport protein